jgi:Domain of unknown function (DUF4148)
MQAIALLNRTVLATLLVSVSVAAFAGGGGPRGSGPYPYSGTAAMASGSTSTATTASAANTNVAQTATNDNWSGKTRAQVRAELIKAEQAGLVPHDDTHYPPDETTIARNKVAFQRAENWWLAHEPSSGTAMAATHASPAAAAVQTGAGLSATDGMTAGKSTVMTAHVTTASMQPDDWWASHEKLNPSVY